VVLVLQKDWHKKEKEEKENMAMPPPAYETGAPMATAPPMMAQPVVAQPMMAQPMQGQPMMAQPMQGQPMMAQPVQQQQVSPSFALSLSSTPVFWREKGLDSFYEKERERERGGEKRNVFEVRRL